MYWRSLPPFSRNISDCFFACKPILGIKYVFQHNEGLKAGAVSGKGTNTHVVAIWTARCICHLSFMKPYFYPANKNLGSQPSTSHIDSHTLPCECRDSVYKWPQSLPCECRDSVYKCPQSLPCECRISVYKCPQLLPCECRDSVYKWPQLLPCECRDSVYKWPQSLPCECQASVYNWPQSLPCECWGQCVQATTVTTLQHFRVHCSQPLLQWVRLYETVKVIDTSSLNVL
jgi:hypothetical protein